jgi:hypothetical protein
MDKKYIFMDSLLQKIIHNFAVILTFTAKVSDNYILSDIFLLSDAAKCEYFHLFRFHQNPVRSGFETIE